VRGGELLDLELQAVAAVSISMGCCLLAWQWALVDSTLALAAAIAATGLMLVIAGAGSLLSARALDVVSVMWGVLALCAVFAARTGSVWLVPLPLLVFALLLARRKRLRQRLRGDPSIVGYVPRPGIDLSLCEFCREPSVGVHAPVFVLSVCSRPWAWSMQRSSGSTERLATMGS